MTFRTYTKKGVFFHAVYIAILTVSGILAVYSAVFGALHISCKEDKIALGFTVFFALASGVLYHRQKNVWSSFVLHFLIAFLPRCFGLK